MAVVCTCLPLCQVATHHRHQPTNMLNVLQDVHAALHRAKDAADAAASAEAARYAQLQAAKLQESAQLQQQLDQVMSNCQLAWKVFILI